MKETGHDIPPGSTAAPARPAPQDHSHGTEVRETIIRNQLNDEELQRAVPPDARSGSGLPDDPGDSQGNDHELPELDPARPEGTA